VLVKLESIYFREPRIFESTFRLYQEKFAEAVAVGRIEKMHFDNGWPLRVGLKRVLELRNSNQVLDTSNELGHMR
jgi:hypothetical protein